MAAPSPRTLRIRIDVRTLIALPLIAAACWGILQLAPILVVLVVALMLAGVLSPLVKWLEQRGLRRTWALGMVFLLLAVVLGAVGFVTAPALWGQISQLLDNLPRLQLRLAHALGDRRAFRPLADAVRKFQLEAPTTPGSNSLASTLAALSLSMLELGGYLATTVVLAIYFLADRERMRGALYALVPRRFHVRLARVLLNLEHIVGHYIRGQIVTSLAITLFVFGLLTLCHIPNALALAVFAGLTDVIPFVGGLLATAPSVLAALAHGSNATLLILLSMLAYQEFESRVLVPRVYGSALRLPPSVVVIALLVGGKLGGIVGAFLALPAAAALLMLVSELRLELPGDDTDDSRLRQRDAQAEADYAQGSAGASPEDAAKVAVQIAGAIEKADEVRTGAPETVPVTHPDKP